MNKKINNTYRQDLLDLAKNPLNFGLFQPLDFVSSEHNPSCGDSVIMGGTMKDGVITSLRFEGSGCVLSMAMASKLTEFATGSSCDEIAGLDERLVEELLGMKLGINRLRCGLLSIMALKKAVELYQQKAVDKA
jgi:nitrogen fixation protein NifU and related proteins